MWCHLLLECIEADESGARAAACNVGDDWLRRGTWQCGAKGLSGLQRTVEEMLTSAVHVLEGDRR